MRTPAVAFRSLIAVGTPASGPSPDRRGGPRLVGGHRHERPELVGVPVDPGEVVLDQLGVDGLARADRGALLEGGQVVQLGHAATLPAYLRGMPRSASRWLLLLAGVWRVRRLRSRAATRRRRRPPRRAIAHADADDRLRLALAPATADSPSPPPHRATSLTRAGASSAPTSGWHSSPWFAGEHRVMIGYGCNAAPWYDHDPRCPGREGFHHGIDVAMPCGTPLFSAVRRRGARPVSAAAHRVRRTACTRSASAPAPTTCSSGTPGRVFVQPGDDVHPRAADRALLRQRRPRRLPPALRGTPPRLAALSDVRRPGSAAARCS